MSNAEDRSHSVNKDTCILSIPKRISFAVLRSNVSVLRLLLLLARLINRQDVVFRSAQSIAIQLSVWSASISPSH